MALLLLTLCGPLLAQAPATKASLTHFLTGPQEGAPLDLAKAYLASHHLALGLTTADLENMVVSDHYSTRHNGVTHIYFNQEYSGIPVWNGLININVARDGSIINLGNRFTGDLASRVSAAAPVLSPDNAITRAAAHLGLEPDDLRLLTNQGGATAEATFSEAGISRDPISTQLRYLVTDNGVRLVWSPVINRVDNADWWTVHIDALTGEVLAKHNWTRYEGGGATYDVFPIPAEDPDDDAFIQTTVLDPADALASPFGWHDDDGDSDPDFTDTCGNNVFAQEDLDANNSGGVGAAGGIDLQFNYFFDPALQPLEGTNLQAAIVNLFYMNNIMHDVTFHYGFDEVGGNFQSLNYSGLGLGGDYVIADAQDGSGTNNANFATPPDGTNPRMQMFIWLPPAELTIAAPASIAGTYLAGSASFGPPLSAMLSPSGDFILVDDGVASASTSDSCEASPPGAYDGLIAVLDRGDCEFGVKVLNAENAGAIAAIVINNQGDGIMNMGAGAVGNMVTIPSIFIGQSDGEAIKAELPSPGVNGSMAPSAPARDSDFDNGIIAHEYGHGISNRLTGGPSNSGCLGGSEQAGEGWSDFWALMLSAKTGDTATQERGIGTYVIFEDSSGPGIRNFPYTTDIAVNPQTYGDIAATNAPHGVGEIWMDMVWEMYWELVTRHGFDEDFYTGSGGNNLTMQLVVDGMKLQPCTPTFTDARDAILMADMVNNGGANQCAIWRAFGKRGLGVSAISGTANVGDETEAFDIPLGCAAGIFSDGFESGDTTVWSSTVGGV
jgi:hypothetical protein